MSQRKIPYREAEVAGVLTIRLFGHARFERDGVAAPFKAPPRAVAVLGYLTTHHDAPVSRNFLAELMWPDDDPEEGRGKLRRHLHLLVGALPKAPESQPYLLTKMQTVRWNVDAPALVDTIAFRQAGAAHRLTDAIGWYGGDFLETHHDDWVISERERLRNAQLGYLRDALHEYRSARDLDRALDAVARILAIDPWREDAVRTEMLLRAQLGDRSGALAAYRTFATRLAAELDTEPTPETRAVYDALARGDALGDDRESRSLPAGAHAPVALPFSGRQTEFDALTRQWDAAARGRGSIVLVSGEAGSGKSRLAHELALHVERQGGGVLLGASTPGDARPYEAVVDALRNSLSLVIGALAAPELGILARVLPEIGARTTVPEVEAAGPVAERQRLFEAVFGAIAALARKRPMVLILDDLHWTTASSATLIEYLVRRIASLPVLIVGTYRDEDVGRAHPLRSMRRRLEREGALTRVALSRFDLATVTDVARRMFSDHGDIAALANQLYAYSEGVPLFLDEAVHATDRAPAGQRLNVPARIEHLGESARTLLEIAAVVGTGFGLELLGEVSGWNESDVLRALDELVEARFVREGRRRRFVDYTFAHHLVHAAVYEAIPVAARRRRHALIAQVMTTLSDDRPESAGDIALHFDRAGDADAAARAYAEAARHARALFANEEALVHAERALALGSEPELIVAMQLMRGWIGHSLGLSLIRSDALAALSAVPVDAARLPELERLRTINAMLEGRFDVARAAADRCLAAAIALGDPSSIAQAHVDAGTIAIVGDRYADAGEHLQRAAEFVRPHDAAAHLNLLRAQTLLAQRRGAHDDELHATASLLLAEAARIGDPQAEAEAHVRIAHVDLAAHRFASARAHYACAVDAYRRFGSPRGIDSVQNNSANLALWTADYETAKDLYAKCLAFAQDNSDDANLFSCATGLTLAHVYTGDLERAAAYVESVAHLYRDSGRLEEANWHLCRALVAAEGGNGEAAAASYDAALAIHRTKPPTALFAVTLALATISALDADDRTRAAGLAAELDALPAELLAAEEFPHLMGWARSRVATIAGDAARAATLLREAADVYDARVSALGDGALAYAAVPWNARFLAARATESVAARPR